MTNNLGGTDTRPPAQWGLLIGRAVRSLPQARNATDAALYACNLRAHKRVKAVVVYRHSEGELWRRWMDRVPVPTQLSFDSYTTQENR